MLKTRIIPCLDVADGRVVKGVNFVDLIDAGDPVDAARAYDVAGADELCFLDIHATHENRGTMFDLVTRTAETIFMPLTVGGGVRTHADVRALLLAGADKVSFTSAAVADPDVLTEYTLSLGPRSLRALLAWGWGDYCRCRPVGRQLVVSDRGCERFPSSLGLELQRPDVERELAVPFVGVTRGLLRSPLAVRGRPACAASV